MLPNTRFIWILLLSMLSTAICAESLKPTWHLLAGAGSSHIGWGATFERVETRDFILRREIYEDRVRGSGWYQNRRTIMVELPLHLLVKPDEPAMFGLSFNSNWMFNLGGQIEPYLFAGGGGLYTKAQIPGTSSEIKGVYQAGGGVRINQGEMQFSLEARYHHVSNGSVREPNDSLNSTKFLFGVRFPLL